MCLSRRLRSFLAFVAVVCTLPNVSRAGEPSGTAFTYQGQLKQGGVPVTDTCDFQFRLFDAESTGNQVGITLLFASRPPPIAINNGLFDVALDFGSDVFTGDARWLQIDVCCSSPCSPIFTTLMPRQELTPASFALFALNGGGDADGHSLDAADGDPVDALIVDNVGHVGIGNAFPFASLTVSNDDAFGVAFSADFSGPVGNAGLFNCSNPSNDETGLSIVHAGTGKGFLSYQYGTGIAGRFEIDNPTSSATALHAVTNGTGPAAFFEGDVGIRTAMPDEALDVDGNILASGTITSGNSITIDGTANTINSTGHLLLQSNGGNVGIGTADPEEDMDVHPSSGGAFVRAKSEDSYAGLIIDRALDVHNGYLIHRTGGVAGWYVGQMGSGGADSNYSISTSVSSAGSKFYLQADGKLGIGTTTPSSKLDVQTSDEQFAIYGTNTRNERNSPIYAVYGKADAGGSDRYGVYGDAKISTTASLRAYGVYGNADADDAADSQAQAYGGKFVASADHYAYGVNAQATTNGWVASGIHASATTFNSTSIATYGVYATVAGTAPTKYAGYFDGNVHVTGNLSASGSKPFRIDHPLDPENKYLYHYAMESPEILNLYRGTVVLNTDGEAWAELPDYFESINRNFTYQLTAVGAPMPNLHVAQEIDGTRFQIAGGKAGLKVSWQLTAVRNDPYVRQYGAPVEVEKPETERGFYQHPELYGQPEERGVEYRNRVEERDPEGERPNERAASNSPEVVEDPLDADKQAKAAEIRRHEQRSETETVRVNDAGEE